MTKTILTEGGYNETLSLRKEVLVCSTSTLNRITSWPIQNGKWIECLKLWTERISPISFLILLKNALEREEDKLQAEGFYDSDSDIARISLTQNQIKKSKKS